MNMKHAAWILVALLFLSVTGVVYAFFLALYPVKTIVINNFAYQAPIHIETPVVHPGDVIRYKLDYCKFTEIVPTSKAQLIDGQIIPLTPGNGNGLPIGCHTTEREVTIPETVNPGRYYYNKELDYPINSLRTERVYYYTEYFQVVDKRTPSTSNPPINEVSGIQSSSLAQEVFTAGQGGQLIGVRD